MDDLSYLHHPPHNLEHEACVLAGMMSMTTEYDGLWPDILNVLKADDFYSPAHRDVFIGIVLSRKMGEGFTVGALHDHLAKQNPRAPWDDVISNIISNGACDLKEWWMRVVLLKSMTVERERRMTHG